MTVRASITGGMRRLGSAKLAVNSAATTNFSFGSPTDIKLYSNANYRPGDRVLVFLSATTAGTTNTLAWTVQDAPDSAGSIGTPATAITTVLTGDSIAATTGDKYTCLAVTLQPGRPWLRIQATGNGVTDTFACSAQVVSVPQSAVG